jgi:hypothetical protein
MSVQLEIRDGNPWWLSTDIWTVPGDDPEGSAGAPIVGLPAYLWATVRNNGDAPVANATVRFYWANPSVGFDRTSANLIGNAFVSLDPGQAQDVLCLTPWLPAFVNGGHECVLAEAFHSSDPLPSSPAFNVPTDRHVAQRNLNVVLASAKRFSASFEIHNRSRKPRVFRIQVEEGRLEELKPLVAHYGKLLEKLEPGKISNWYLTERTFVCNESGEVKNENKTYQVAPGGRAGLTLAGEITGGAALIHVRQFDEQREVGGLSVLVINQEEAR